MTAMTGMSSMSGVVTTHKVLDYKRDDSPVITPSTGQSRVGTQVDTTIEGLDKSSVDGDSERAAEFVFPTRQFVA